MKEEVLTEKQRGILQTINRVKRGEQHELEGDIHEMYFIIDNITDRLSAETQRRQAAEAVVELAVSDSVDSLRLCEELALQYFAKYPKETAT